MTIKWQPSASLEMLKKRAAILAKIRAFFATREVLEVETPLLAHATVPDPYILSIPASIRDPHSSQENTYYLQTSPEYAMKRLLAAGCGSIYQICKAFRQDELGRLHNPEFTILEWYRLRFDHHALMDEVDDLFHTLLQTPAADRYTYTQAFEHFLGINPHTASLRMLEDCARAQTEIILNATLERDGWLNLLMSHGIEPHLGPDRPAFIYDFPASQAALARLRPGNPALASRFEVYYHGIELGNGFHELQDAKEQRARFLRDLDQRNQQGIPTVPLDERFLAALNHGLPDCAGIAIGIDRLVMLALGAEKIEELISFSFENA